MSSKKNNVQHRSFKTAVLTAMALFPMVFAALLGPVATAASTLEVGDYSAFQYAADLSDVSCTNSHDSAGYGTVGVTATGFTITAKSQKNTSTDVCGNTTTSYKQTTTTLTLVLARNAYVEFTSGNASCNKTSGDNYSKGTKFEFTVQSSSSNENNVSATITFTTSDCAGYEEADSAMYYVSTTGKNYFNLDEAVAAANGAGSIIVVGSGKVYTSEYDTEGTNVTIDIPSGVSFLVPYNDAHTADFDTEPTLAVYETKNSENVTIFNYDLESTDPSVTYPYMELTIPTGTTINISGSMNVNSKVFNHNGRDTGCPVGPYGHVILENGSNLNIKGNASLYCYGYITGTFDEDGNYTGGAVTAESSANVYELFQLRDWRGASKLLDYVGQSFILSQYYVQNIEADYNIHAGANSSAVMSMMAVAMGSPVDKSIAVSFVGSSDSLFILSSGYITRTYRPLTEQVLYTLNKDGDTAGSMVLSSIKLNLTEIAGDMSWIASALGYEDIDSANYILGLNNNLGVRIASGCTGELAYRIKLLPGSELYVEEDATLTVTAGTGGLYIYDRSHWNSSYTRWGYETASSSTSSNVSFVYDNEGIQRELVRYSPSRVEVLGSNSVELPGNYGGSAKVTVNGTLIGNGNIFTTSGYQTVSAKKDTSAATSTPNVSQSVAYQNQDKLLSGTGTFINQVDYADAVTYSYGYTDGNLNEDDGITYYYTNWSATEGIIASFTHHGELDELYSNAYEVKIPCTPLAAYIAESGGTPSYRTDWATGTTYHGYDWENFEAPTSVWVADDACTTITVTVIAGEETLDTWELYAPAGTDLSAYYTDRDCTTPATTSYDGTSSLSLYCPVTARVDFVEGGSKYYMTLLDAVTAATTVGDAVHLLKDTTASTLMLTDAETGSFVYYGSPIQILAAQDIDIYLNGHDVTYADNLFNIYGTVDLNLGGTNASGENISGGTITNAVLYNADGTVAAVAEVSPIRVRNGATLNLDLNGGTLAWSAPSDYVRTSTSVIGVVYNYNVGNVNIDLNGGTIKADYPTKYDTSKYGKIYAIYNYGIMNITDSTYDESLGYGSGLITSNTASSYTTQIAKNGNTFYGSYTIYSTTNSELSLDRVTVTQTSTTGSRYHAALLCYRTAAVTIDESRLNCIRAYALINAAGTINSITNTSIGDYYDAVNSKNVDGYYGIYNWNTRSGSSGKYRPGYIGTIEKIEDCTISVTVYGIRNRAQIGVICGDTTITATTSDSYAIYNYNTPAYESLETTYVDVTQDDGSKIRTYTYVWDNIPTIAKITDNVVISGIRYVVANQGAIDEIGGSSVIAAKTTGTDNTTGYYALGVISGGYVGKICDNATIIGGTATIADDGTMTLACKGYRAIYIQGQHALTRVVTYDSTGVMLKDEYTYDVSCIDEINGSTAEGDTGVRLWAYNYTILNYGDINNISGKVTIYTSTAGGRGIYHAGTKILTEDVYTPSYTGSIKLYDNVDGTATLTSEEYEYKPSYIGTIGGEGSTILFDVGRYGITAYDNAHIDFIGKENDSVTFQMRDTTTTTSNYGLSLSAGATIGIIGGQGSVVTINTAGTDKAATYGIYLASGAHIETIGGTGSTVTINKESNSSTSKKSAYGIYIAASGATIGTIAAPGSTVEIEDAYTSNGYGYGIYLTSSGEDIVSKITTIGAEDPDGILANGKVVLANGNYNVCVVDCGRVDGIYGDITIKRGYYGIYSSSEKGIGSIGSDASKISITVSRYGIYANASSNGYYGLIENIGAAGATSACVEIKSGRYAIYCAAGCTINKITDGVVAISTDTSGDYYALYNAGTIDLISGGDYYHANGRANAVYNPDSQTYPDGYGLSMNTRTVTLSDGTTTYPCYYVHQHDYEAVVTDPTCTESGYTTHTCTVCGHSYVDDEFPATGHKYTAVVTKPTCTEGGYTTYTCACGDSYVGDYTDAAGHSEVTVGAAAPTCTVPGYTGDTKCSVCGEVLNLGKEIPATGHSWNETLSYDENNHWQACDNCSEIQNEEEHNYDASGACTGCNWFKFYRANVNLGNDLDMMFAFSKAAADAVSGSYVEVVRTYTDGREAVTTQIAKTQWTVETIDSVEYYVVTYGDFAAKEMCDTVTLTVYNSGNKAVSEPWEDSIQEYALRALESSTDSDSYLRAVVVDMLNYGAACQTALGYPNASPTSAQLVTSVLTDTQKGWATTGLTLVDSHGTNLAKTTYWNGGNLVTTSNIQFLIAFKGLSDDMYVTYSFTGHKGNSNVESETKKTGAEITANGGYIQIKEVVVADAGFPVTITVYNADGTVIETWQDSIKSYAARNQTSGDDVFNAFMKFANSAYTYLHSASQLS